MRTYPIKRIVKHSETVKSFYFDKIFDAEPGQFINLWLPGVDEKPFSISNIADGEMELSIKKYGVFTTRLFESAPGDYVGIRGPFGRGSFSLRRDALLVGGGIGIAPLRFLAKRLQREKISFVSLLGALSKDELIFRDDFEKISSCYFTTDDGSFGKKGRVTDILAEIIESRNIKYVYAAGPEIMYLPLLKILNRYKMSYEISFERYMKCGIGICGQCTLDGSGIRVCLEGPVLKKELVEQITEIGAVHRDASGRRIVNS
jgi:dihydroorotate dehydrogenase electron transfer subunit